jgi:putative tricarboxylic transport membrane protein
MGCGVWFMVQKEWILNVVMFLFGIVIIVKSLHLGLGSLARPGVGLFPFIAGVGLSLVTFFPALKKFIAARKEYDRDGGQKFFGPSVINVLVSLIALVIYSFILPWLGYLISTFMLLAILFKIAGFRKWVFTLTVSFIAALATYIVFYYWLSVRLPKGILGF